MIVLCLGCGMRVLAQADGSCPSCGARGPLSVRVWQGEHVEALIPADTTEPTSVRRYACLYLRPFANKFRAAARMRAIARAVRPFGATVALHGSEARLRLLGRDGAPHFGVFIHFYAALWNATIDLIEYALREALHWQGVELIDVKDDRWRQTFRQLASHSRVIVMDASAATIGISYEAEFIADLALGGRLIVLQNEGAAARKAAQQHVQRLRSAGLDVPLVPYSTWKLRRLTKDLAQLATRRLESPT